MANHYDLTRINIKFDPTLTNIHSIVEEIGSFYVGPINNKVLDKNNKLSYSKDNNSKPLPTYNDERKITSHKSRPNLASNHNKK
jgi:hypothetical protein